MVDERGFWAKHTDPDVYLKKGIGIGKKGVKTTYKKTAKAKTILKEQYSKEKQNIRGESKKVVQNLGKMIEISPTAVKARNYLQGRDIKKKIYPIAFEKGRGRLTTKDIRDLDRKLEGKDPVDEAIKLHNAKYSVNVKRAEILPYEAAGLFFNERNILLKAGKNKKVAEFITASHELNHFKQRHDSRFIPEKYLKGRLFLRRRAKDEIEAEKGTYLDVKDYLSNENKTNIKLKRTGRRVKFTLRHPFRQGKYLSQSIDHALLQPGESAPAKYLKDKSPESVKKFGRQVSNSAIGKFFGRQGKKGLKELHGFKTKPAKYVFGKEKAAVSKSLKATKAIAIANLNAAAEIKVNEKGIFAVFQPIFWGCKLSALAMANAYPILLTGLIFGILFGTWFFGLISAYYALHFLRCIPAVIINVALTIGNALWFAAMGLYNLLVLGVITIINTIAYFFVGPVYEFISALEFWKADPIQMPTIIHKYTIQPNQGFLYLYPNPMETSGSISTIFLSIFSYSWLRPGEEPYQYTPNNEIATYIVFVDDLGAELRYPYLNPAAISPTKLWGDLTKDKPPPQYYSFTDPAKWGALMVDGIFKTFPQKEFFRHFLQSEPPILAALMDVYETIVSGPRLYRIVSVNVPKIYVGEEFIISWELRVGDLTMTEKTYEAIVEILVDDEVVGSWNYNDIQKETYKHYKGLVFDDYNDHKITIQAYYISTGTLGNLYASSKQYQSKVEFTAAAADPPELSVTGGMW